jgi:hypothetical protein
VNTTIGRVGPWSVGSSTNGINEAFIAKGAGTRVQLGTDISNVGTVYMRAAKQSLDLNGYTLSTLYGDVTPIQVGSPSTFTDFPSVTNGTINCATGTLEHGLAIYGARFGKVTNLVIDHCYDGASFTDATSDVDVINLKVLRHGPVSRGTVGSPSLLLTNSHGVLIDAGSGVTFIGLKVYPNWGTPGDCEGNGFVRGGDAVLIKQALGLTIDRSSDLRCSDYGIRMAPTDADGFNRSIQYSRIEATPDANRIHNYSLVPTGNTDIHDIDFPTIWGGSAGLACMNMQPTGGAKIDNISINGGRVVRCGVYGIFADPGTGSFNGISINNVEVMGNGTSETTLNTGILIQSINKVTIRNTRVGSSQFFGAPAIGIRVYGSMANVDLCNSVSSSTQGYALDAIPTGYWNVCENSGSQSPTTLNANAATIALPNTGVGLMKVTGTTSVTKLKGSGSNGNEGLWTGREITLYRPSGGSVCFNAGGSIADSIGGAFAKSVCITDNESVKYKYAEGYWWPIGK